MLSAFSKHLKFADRPSKDLGSVTRVITTAVLIFFISQFFASLFAVLIFSFIDNTSVSASLIDNSIPADFTFVLFAEVLAVWLVFNILKRRKVNLEFIGLGRKTLTRDVMYAILAFFAYYGLLIVVNVILSVVFPDFKTDQKQNLGFNNINGIVSTTLAFIALTILPPIAEEILVRGYLYSGLKSRVNWKYAAVITSVMFAVAHLELGSGAALVWGAAIQTFVLSMVLIRLRDVTGALYAGILLHFLNNAIAFSVIYH